MDFPWPEMVRLRGGSFIMGSDSGREDEAPPHLVVVSPFSISRYAVTNRDYALFLDQSHAPPPPSWDDPKFNHPDQPAVSVSWFEASAFCEWLSRTLGGSFRLPSEAEREFACRAGTSTAYPWGDDADPKRGEYGSRWHEGGPETVGGQPNGFGLLNMADNVHEWCLDWYGRDYYRISPLKDPPGPPTGVRRVARGGSWRHKIKVTRSSARSALDPGFRYTDFGFRVVRGEDHSI